MINFKSMNFVVIIKYIYVKIKTIDYDYTYNLRKRLSFAKNH